MRGCECPGCGNPIAFDVDNQDFMFCKHCGRRIDLNDSRQLYKYIDVAKIKETDNNLQVKLKEMELEQKNKEKISSFYIILLIISLIGVAIFGFIGYNQSNETFAGFTCIFGICALFFFSMLHSLYKKPEDPEVEKAAIEAIERMYGKK